MEKSKKLNSFLSISKDVVILSLGIIAASAIPLALQPYLKRTFTPEEFGAYDVFLKCFSILVALSCFKYENAILLPKKDTDAKHIVYLCLFLSLLVAFVLGLLILFFADEFLAGLEGLTLAALYLLPLSSFFYAVFNVFNLYLVRRRKFMLSSTSKLSRRLTEGGTQVALGELRSTDGLVIGDAVGNFVQGLFAFWKANKLSRFKILNQKKLRKVFVEYRELPIYTLIPNVLNTFVTGALTFLILDNFDIVEVGYLEFTQRILSVPSVFVSVAISQVVFQRVSNLVNRRKKIMPLILSVMGLLFFVSSLFILFIEFFGERVFTLIGGEGWEKSGQYAKTLVYASAVILVFSPLGKVLIALKKFKVNSLWELAKFAAILYLFFLKGFSIQQYLWIYTIILIFFYVVYGVLIIHQSYRYQVENTAQT
ncbi:lipopolysaccharide biosynthesis protein [Euzebyella saccharophila]|uniref:Lipopolysaccharide biosynthesis protein n=1 Tax=Euzebyella saccharophila TaxID=679664 RepID=A0ABV8JNV5_9FLAO|nr:lipopolysaccharide biosynthesis protein [Euzebyella saccharophila]